MQGRARATAESASSTATFGSWVLKYVPQSVLESTAGDSIGGGASSGSGASRGSGRGEASSIGSASRASSHQGIVEKTAWWSSNSGLLTCVIEPSGIGRLR